MSLSERWRQHLDDLHHQGRRRRLIPPHGLDFSSNDYLGYARLPYPVCEELTRSGMASRLLRGDHDLWHLVESRLADWHGAESALVFNSGYVANEGVLATLIEGDDVVFSDALNHASIIDGLRLTKARRHIFRHNDLDHLEVGLRDSHAGRRSGQELFVVTESLFGMDGDRAPLAEIAEIAERYAAHVIVDEAHATGCFGENGSGRVDELGLRGRILASIHTGGKALGVSGAYVVGSTLLKETLVNRCRHFIFTTALPPQLAVWWLEMLDRVAGDTATRRRLHDNAAFFRRELARRHLATTGVDYVVPITIGADADAVAAASRLQELGYDIRAIRPPTVPVGTARLRIAIHADHDENTLRELAERL